MTTVREIMTTSTECVASADTVQHAAEVMTRTGASSLSVVGENGRLQSMITDRDIVIRVLGTRMDPATTLIRQVGGRGAAATIGPDDDVGQALRTMNEHEVRSLPVVDGHDLIGRVSQADLARVLPIPQVADLLRALSTD